MTNQNTKSALESLLFVWGQPLEAKTAAELFGLSTGEILDAFRELKEEYTKRGGGLMIREIDRSFQLCTNPENDDYIRRLCTPAREKRLSQSALEVLAVIAYRQPVTKSQIENVRGIRCDRVLEGLLKKELVEERGRSTAIGRPILYGTTKKFLQLFGFESLEDLPVLEDLEELLPEDAEEDVLAGQLSILDVQEAEEDER